jgi:hypothetical protein
MLFYFSGDKTMEAKNICDREILLSLECYTPQDWQTAGIESPTEYHARTGLNFSDWYCGVILKHVHENNHGDILASAKYSIRLYIGVVLGLKVRA